MSENIEHAGKKKNLLSSQHFSCHDTQHQVVVGCSACEASKHCGRRLRSQSTQHTLELRWFAGKHHGWYGDAMDIILWQLWLYYELWLYCYTMIILYGYTMAILIWRCPKMGVAPFMYGFWKPPDGELRSSLVVLWHNCFRKRPWKFSCITY